LIERNDDDVCIVIDHHASLDFQTIVEQKIACSNPGWIKPKIIILVHVLAASLHAALRSKSED
jgi:hypothetical protein